MQTELRAKIEGAKQRGELRVYYWNTDHIGHWPKGLMGELPLSVLFPTEPKMAKSLAEDIEREGGAEPNAVLTFPLTEDETERVLNAIDTTHTKPPCYSVTPPVARALHKAARVFPFVKEEPLDIQNCTTVVTAIIKAAGIDASEAGIVPKDLFQTLEELRAARLSPNSEGVTTQGIADVVV